MINFITEFFVFIIGAAIGSFLNVLIDRLPHNKSINGRSHCDYCKQKIAWYDLFPIVSFFVLRGRTRCCNKKLSWQYPLVEMITGIAFVCVMSFRPSEARGGIFFLDPSTSFPSVASLGMTLGVLGIISCLIVIFVSDLKYHLISDYILFALFVFSLFFRVIPNLFRDPIIINEILKLVQNDIISSLIVALPIFLIYYLSKERAMGLGDVYLSAIIGFLLGWQRGFLALYVAFVTGAIFGIGLIILHRKKIKSKIAFGPFLVIGTVIMLFWGEKILEIIKKIYGF